MNDDGIQFYQQHQQWVRDYESTEKEMTMKWKDSGGGDFEQPPVGTFTGRCIKIIDIGTQRGEYQGKATSRRQVIIGWELPTELMTEGEYAGKPFYVSKFYTASLGEKANLRKDLENWRGRAFNDQELGGFESKNILGKACMLSLTLNDKGKVRVTGIMALPKGMPVPPQINPITYFSLDEFDLETFEGISDGIKKMITASPEYEAAMKRGKGGGAGTIDDLESDIPFASCAFSDDVIWRKLRRGSWE